MVATTVSDISFTFSMPVSIEKKALVAHKIKPYKTKIEELKKEISRSKLAARRNQRLAPFLILKSAIGSIAYSNTLVLMSELSEKIQGVKNNAYLSEARKEISNCINELNNIFGKQLNAPLTENQELLERIYELKPVHKLCFIQEVSNAIQQIKIALGEKSKWRWSFPDMHYRFIVFSKNWFDFKLLGHTKDPGDDNFRPLQDYISVLMDEAHNAAQEFRSRYELSTQEIDDLHKIRDIFEMQKQVYILLHRNEEFARVQTSLDNISEKIESLVAKKDKKVEAKWKIHFIL